jgi:phospholipid/cholesterol/gamma-HCH transport system substrate-binding protein
MDAAGAPPGGAYGSSGSASGRSQASGQSKETDSKILPYQAASTNSVYMTGYDPVTGAYVGPDGKRYVVGATGGQQRLLGDASWKWLLLGPLTK